MKGYKRTENEFKGAEFKKLDEILYNERLPFSNQGFWNELQDVSAS
ncbi:hypothetical protein [Paenibacillus thermotolerans]|nr:MULTISPECIES: hypothetical protein [unclassified Paenibacillus]